MRTATFEVRDGIITEVKCDYCGGSGRIATDESDGEGHIMQGVGREKCICQIEN